MARRYFNKHIDANQLQEVQAHIAPGDYGTDLVLGQHVNHECSIVFFDLVNFTNISWSLTTSQVMSTIQPLFQKVSIEITNYGGMVDKFPGDGVVGFFPRLYTNAENKIVDNAIDCATKVMNWFYTQLRPSVSLPKRSHTLELCAGIDSGSISIAHVGTPIHSELILLGDQVNCASKCQGAAEKREIIVGQNAISSAHHKGFYDGYMSTGPSLGVVYTATNNRYLSFRFDWEKYCSDYEWAR